MADSMEVAGGHHSSSRERVWDAALHPSRRIDLNGEKDVRHKDGNPKRPQAVRN